MPLLIERLEADDGAGARGEPYQEFLVKRYFLVVDYIYS
jgi:hypothetical protein